LNRKHEVVELRRRYVFEMVSKGKSQADIARTLQVAESTISNDAVEEATNTTKHVF
jgi:DNA-binding NarL/FixJ family response regulator